MVVKPERIVRQRDVEPISWGGEESATMLLRGTDTGGRFSYYEVSVPTAQGSLYHEHTRMDETFHVVSGAFQITIGGRVHQASPGTVVFAPHGIPHSFYNVSDSTSTMLCVASPGGIELFFEDLRDLLDSDPPPRWENLRQLASVHGIVAYQPQGGPHGTNVAPR